MSDEEFLKWAIDLIEKGVEIMTVEQLSEWEGVRAFLDTVPYSNALAHNFDQANEGISFSITVEDANS